MKFQVLGGDHERHEDGVAVTYVRGMVFEAADDVRLRWPNSFLLLDDAVEVSKPYRVDRTPTKIERSVSALPIRPARRVSEPPYDPAHDPEVQAMAKAVNAD